MRLHGDNGTVELVGIKRPAVAGTFYPREPARLRGELETFLAEQAPAGPPPKALIAPHAGYVYSGPVAGTVYARLAGARGRIERVVLLGPSHYVPLAGVATSSAGLFETPLGRIAVDREALAVARRLPFVREDDAAFAREHSLEVHLPFLQQVLGEFRLVPLVIGEADAGQVATLLARLWGGEETCIVVSSDLSHYHEYGEAARRDAATAAAIEALRPEAIGFEDACGRNGIRGLLALAGERGLRCERVDLRSSGDTAGPRDRVVGYGAWAFYEPADPGLAERDRETLLAVARDSIRHGLEHGSAATVDPAGYGEALRAVRASFVTLHLDGRLRGCIGSIEARRALVSDVAENAYAAAFRDPRFAPLTGDEYPRVQISVSVLSPLSPIAFASEEELIGRLRPGVDGLVLEAEGHRGTFLPAVWESLPEPRRFLAELKRKAGLPADYWSDAVRVSRYTTESFS